MMLLYSLFFCALVSFFFFSSRRRHTRFKCDWSSDVSLPISPSFKLDSMKEGDSTVLNNSMVLFASALSDGNSHNPHKLPMVLAGRAGGRIDAGQHLVYGEDSPVANLYVSMLDAFGAPVERFADSTGPLTGLLA